MGETAEYVAQELERHRPWAVFYTGLTGWRRSDRRKTMARVVGDKLIVNLARKPGEEQILDLLKLFNENPNRTIVVAGTVSADGAPNTAPVSLIYAKDEKTLLVATVRNSTTATNLRRDGRVSFEIFGSGDLVIGILGSMRLAKEPMDCSDAMAMWE